jgi:urea carboxylase
VTSTYDPLLAKLIAGGATRGQALERLRTAVEQTRISGIRTNLGLLSAALRHPAFEAANHTTTTLAAVRDEQPRIEVRWAGTHTIVQDWPGRRGYWHVGVPPSGPMDDRSLRLGNVAVGNPEGAAGLECTLDGPALRFSHQTTVCVCGAGADVTLDGTPIPGTSAAPPRSRSAGSVATAAGC